MSRASWAAAIAAMVTVGLAFESRPDMLVLMLLAAVTAIGACEGLKSGAYDNQEER